MTRWVIKNKKGIALEGIFEIIAIIFILVVVIGLFMYSFDTIVEGLRQPSVSNAGNVNLTEAVDLTIGKINSAAQTKMNLVSIFLIFGMVFGLVFSTYMLRDRYPALFFIVDFVILIFAYIIAVYLANSYEIIINSIPFKSIYTSNLSWSTMFILKLPKIVLFIGSLTAIVAYSAIPRQKEEVVAGVY